MGSDPRKIPSEIQQGFNAKRYFTGQAYFIVFIVQNTPLMKFAQLNKRGFHHSVLEEDTQGRPGKLR